MADSTTPQAPTLGAGQRTYVLLVLTLIYTLAFVDRQIINILAEPIKHELHLADWQMGALAGFAFAMLYTVVGLPIARYSEYGNRSRIISAALLVWSGFTALSGLAGNFAHLLLARIGVGVGEAGCVPPSHSLITDITPREKRASALAIFSAGVPLGSLVGLGVGGLVAHAYGWRTAFFLCGIPGIALALLVLLTIRDPRMQAAKDAATPAKDVPTLWQTFSMLRKQRSFLWLTAGASMVSFTAFAHQTFYASFYLRNHGADLESLAASLGVGGALGVLGLCLGLIVGLAGTCGSVIGGRLADRFGATDAGGYMIVPIWSNLLAVPFLVAVFAVPDGRMSLLLLLIPTFFKLMWFGPVFAGVQSLVAPGTRATAVALFLFVVNIVGLGLGPVFMGALSDVLGHAMGPAEGLRVALIVLSVQLVVPAFCFARARRTLSQETIS